MLYHKRGCHFREDKNAVVGIVTAILLISLISIVLAVINLEFVPKWMEDKEAEHMETVASQFSEMAHTINSQAAFQTKESISSPIKLGSEPFWFFISSPSWGSLQVAPEEFDFSVDSKNVLLKEYKGTDYAGFLPGETKILPPTGSKDETNITKISYFMLNITHFRVGNDEWGMVNTTVKDKNGNLVGYVEVKAVGIQPETHINLKTVGYGNELYNQPILIMKNDNFTNYRINLLNPDYRFTEVLNSADAPFNVTLSLSSSDGKPNDGNSPDISASYTIAYTQYNQTAGESGVGEGGKEEKDFGLSYKCGTLKYSSDNSYFVDQDYIFDGSGVVVHQDILGKKGDIFLQPPSISIERLDNRTRMNFMIVNISSSGPNQISGTGITSVKTKYISSEKTAFKTHELNITISTKYVNAWEEFFNNSFTNAGFVWNGDYTISPAANKITINFKGKDKTTERDIEFYLNYAVVEADIGIPAG